MRSKTVVIERIGDDVKVLRTRDDNGNNLYMVSFVSERDGREIFIDCSSVETAFSLAEALELCKS